METDKLYVPAPMILATYFRQYLVVLGRENVTGYTVTVDPRGNDCGETLQRTVDSVGGVHI